MDGQLSREQNFKETRDLSIKEGSATSVMNGAADSYIAPFAMEIKASNLEISLLTSLNGLISPIVQIIGSWLMEKFERKQIVVISILLQALALFLFVGIGLAYWSGFQASFWAEIFLLAYLIYTTSGSLGGSAWISLIGDAVPEKMRGRYFSRRNHTTGLFNIGTTIFAAIFLFYAKAGNLLMLGFIALFLVASAARYISARLMAKHYVEKLAFEPGYKFSFWQFAKGAPKSDFGRFSIYVALINLAINIANPFFSIYLWQSLGLNPLWFTAVVMAPTLFSTLAMPAWGKFADQYGNRELLRLANYLIVPAPIFWLFSANPIYIILVPQLLLGLGWAAFTLATSNYVFDAVHGAERGRVSAYHNLLNGMGIFLGATIGGLMSQCVHISFMNVFLFIFVTSAAMRYVVAVIFLPKVKELRSEIAAPHQNPFHYLPDAGRPFGLIRGVLVPILTLRFLRVKKED